MASKELSFTSPEGSHINKVVLSYKRDDQLRILVNNQELMRSTSDLYCGVAECGQSNSTWYSKTISTSLFVNGTNTITFVNYNHNRECTSSDMDDMFYYANLTVYYQ